MDEVVRDKERLSVSLPYPRLFAELLAGHSFVAFEVAGVRIHSNLRGEEDNLEDLLADKLLTVTLVEAGFLPFGRPDTGDYDRVCFDMRDRKQSLDAPVVQMDHEAILSFNQIPRPRQLADGIVQLFEKERAGLSAGANPRPADRPSTRKHKPGAAACG